MHVSRGELCEQEDLASCASAGLANNQSPSLYADTPVVTKKNAAPVGADSLDSTAGDAMIGRKIVKSVGETVCSGVVRDFFPATGNQEESKWKVEWDDGDDVMAVVNRAELDKYLRMQMTKEAVFGPAVCVCVYVVLCAPFCGVPFLLPWVALVLLCCGVVRAVVLGIKSTLR